MSEALRLFRDFVEKLERAYIAFDGVVGSCLGAWGGTNYGMEDDDVDVIPRNSIHYRRTRLILSAHRLTLPLLSLIVSEYFSSTFSARILFFFTSLQATFRYLEGRERKNLTVCRSNHSFMSQKFFSLFFSFFFSFLPAAYFPICILLSFFFSSLCFQVISILEWVNAYSKQ